MKQVTFLLLLWLIATNLYGQERSFILSGNINDDQGEPLLYGDVILLSLADSLPLKYTYIQEGHFTFDPITTGDYILKISCLGYEQVFQDISLDENKSMNFTLSENTTDLAEATVTASRSTIINKNGNLIVNIANSVFASQPSTMDLLSQLPTLMVGSNGESVSIIGKGSPLIYLGNQRITAADLNSIPVASIKSVEIINNPSAKYETEGRAVLLITRVPNLSDGYNIQLSETASFKRTFDNYAGIHANFKKNKLELRTHFAFNALTIWESVKSNYEVPQQDLLLDSKALSTGARPQYVMGGGIHYQINKDDYISAQANTRFFTDDADIEGNSLIQQGQSVDAIQTFSDDSSDRGFFSSNINYNKKLKAGNLFLGVQYSTYSRDLSSVIANNYNETEFMLSQNRYQKYSIDAVSLRADFEKNIDEHTKWEMGVNIYTADALAFQDFEFLDPPASLLSNYDYLERNYAAYTQLSGSIKKMTYSAGLRSETTVVKGSFRSSDTLVIDRTEPKLFPRFTLNIPIDSSKSITLNYTNTINRPHYLNSSSITTFINPIFEYTRNANLKSTTTQELSLNFQYKNQSLNLSYFHRKDPVNTSIFYDEANARLVSSPENFDQETGFNLRVTSPITYKFWNTTNVAMVSYSKIKDSRAEDFDSKPFLYFYSNNRFTISPTAHFNLTFFGITKRHRGVIIEQPLYSTSLGVSKRFFEKLTVSINYNDIFRTMQWESKYKINQISSQNIFLGNISDLYFSLKYSFGKISKSNYKNKNVDDNIDRMR